jgi:hypothetical protein
LFLGFKKELGVKGFWIGYLVSLVMLDIIVGFFVVFADWSPKISEKEKTAHNELETEEDGKKIAD